VCSQVRVSVGAQQLLFNRFLFIHPTMNLSFDTSQVSPSAIPGLLWAYYVQYLWNYDSDSWVARIAYSCRILAILVSLPLIILGLLDIASYGIARTLGVIDDVKASTSDKATIITPPTPGSDSAFSDSDHDSLTDHNLHNRMRSPLSDSLLPGNTHFFPALYFLCRRR